MEKLVWNVYRCRNGQIQVYNIFQHGKFSDEVKQLLQDLRRESPLRELWDERRSYYTI